MKRFLTVVLFIFAALCTLSGCGCDDGKDIDLVFINDSDAAIMTVRAAFKGGAEEARCADSSSLKRGETFGFDVGVMGRFPVTVVAYGNSGQELGSIIVKTAPPDGERWYVVARDGENGLAFDADFRWPEGV